MSFNIVLDNPEPGDLINVLMQHGFTPEAHPNIIRDMAREFKTAAAHAGVTMEDKLSCRFMFDENGVTGAVVTREE